MRFEFATSARIIFGEGTLGEAGPLAAEMGTRILVVTGSDPQRAQGLLDSLKEAGLPHSVFSVPREPTIPLVEEGVEVVRRDKADLLIGIGGGSALDAAKALAALSVNPGEPLDYLEVIGKGKKMELPSLPCIAIPTTAGTGTEVTRNAVLASPEQRVKVSLRSITMLPRLAIVDPELTYTLPVDVTVSTGMDALTQLIEPFLSRKANPMTDALAREGIPKAVWALPRLFEEPRDKKARRDMSLVSLFGGLALANSGLGAVHGFAGPLGGMLGASHGALCAALLPSVLKRNMEIAEGLDDEDLLQRFSDLAVLLTGNPDAAPMEGFDFLYRLTRSLNVPGLAAHGLTVNDFPEAVSKARHSSSMKGNPVSLKDEVLESILKSSL